MTYKYTLPQIAALLADRMDALIGELGLAGTGHLEKDEWVCLNPTRADRHTGSFRIRVRGPKRGSWREYAGDVHGDALELIAYVSGVGKAEAVRRARAFWGLTAPPRLPRPWFSKRNAKISRIQHMISKRFGPTKKTINIGCWRRRCSFAEKKGLYAARQSTDI